MRLEVDKRICMFHSAIYSTPDALLAVTKRLHIKDGEYLTFLVSRFRGHLNKFLDFCSGGWNTEQV